MGQETVLDSVASHGGVTEQGRSDDSLKDDEILLHLSDVDFGLNTL